jgi:hypothetical protein
MDTKRRKDDADQRAGNANPPHSLVLSIALNESFNGEPI